MTEGKLGQPHAQLLDERFLIRLFCVFLILALASVGLSLAGKHFGRMIAMGGHTDQTTLYEVIIADEVFLFPANAIRQGEARRHGKQARINLYLRWPEMSGFSVDYMDSFNNVDGSGSIIFLTIEPQTMSRDMSGRLQPIYQTLIEAEGRPGVAGLLFHNFLPKAGYFDEILVVGEREEGPSFVARCLTGEAAETSLAPCQRDIHLPGELSLSYRFAEARLADWQRLDSALLGWLENRRVIR